MTYASVSRMRDPILAILFLLGLFVVLPISILWLRDKIFHSSRKQTPEQVQLESTPTANAWSIHSKHLLKWK